MSRISAQCTRHIDASSSRSTAFPPCLQAARDAAPAAAQLPRGRLPRVDVRLVRVTPLLARTRQDCGHRRNPRARRQHVRCSPSCLGPDRSQTHPKAPGGTLPDLERALHGLHSGISTCARVNESFLAKIFSRAHPVTHTHTLPTKPAPTLELRWYSDGSRGRGCKSAGRSPNTRRCRPTTNSTVHVSRLLTITSGVHIAEAAVVCHVQLVAVPRVAAEARRAAAEAQHRRAVHRVLVDAKEEVT